MSPELLLAKEPATQAGDIWLIGATLGEFFVEEDIWGLANDDIRPTLEEDECDILEQIHKMMGKNLQKIPEIDKISPNLAIYESVYTHQNNSHRPPP